MLLRRPSFLAALVILLLVGTVWGVTAARAAQARTLEQHTHDIAAQLQCLVCNGESAADSPSPFAQQVRAIIRHKLEQGESDQQILDYFHQHYGDAILETPPAQGFTLLIWLGPLLMLLAGIVLLTSVAREWRVVKLAPVSAVEDEAGDLSDEELGRYRALLRRELDAEEGMPSRRKGVVD
jgi:cytochrome c-type biogenesis protein CcmH